MGAQDIKEKYLSEVSSYNEDEYREEIRKDAEKYGVQYKENYDENMNATAANKRKKLLIIAGISVLALAGLFIYFKKTKKWIFAKK